MAAVGAGLFVFLFIFLVWLGFLLSLNKLVNVMRVDGLPQTFISKIWVWSQVIPFWGFIALIVFNIKADTASRALESEFKLPFKEIKYPATIGWIVILGLLYTWIPILGALVLLVCMILFWIKVSSTSKQIEDLKLNTKTTIES
ncbi:MAG: hypothetical protein AB7S49_01895 [Arcobacter sp.]|uniref:Membrane protein n=1 Tax=Arcobacter defluvii TaxID=873191 RepID=A0AAE7BBH6_9BACT|nr:MULTISPECIES: hypothetical protein [Arcobacter]QKF76435.1 putative membrane protein [Arcobacter defluvii]RXI34584.1 hypothetical protein CP964_00360 [Arcobacter defluvii]BAK72236.1 hypothetical protein ABLL_0361 [Arcobacter sp. L]